LQGWHSRFNCNHKHMEKRPAQPESQPISTLGAKPMWLNLIQKLDKLQKIIYLIFEY